MALGWCFRTALVVGIVIATIISGAGWCHTNWEIENLKRLNVAVKGDGRLYQANQVGVATFTSGVLPSNITVNTLLDDVIMTSQTINEVLFM